MPYCSSSTFKAQETETDIPVALDPLELDDQMPDPPFEFSLATPPKASRYPRVETRATQFIPTSRQLEIPLQLKEHDTNSPPVIPDKLLSRAEYDELVKSNSELFDLDFPGLKQRLTHHSSTEIPVPYQPSHVSPTLPHLFSNEQQHVHQPTSEFDSSPAYWLPHSYIHINSRNPAYERVPHAKVYTHPCAEFERDFAEAWRRSVMKKPGHANEFR
ncbi:hypothetical protein C0995_015371 [Termitomyces sp. Mi166|nr:hypothetical protein C0995_015371 [Termitomyces sp. Mi166\